MDSNKAEQEPAERTDGSSPVVLEGSSATQTEVKPRQTTETTAKSLKCKKPKAKADGTHAKKASKSKKVVVTSDEDTESESTDSSSDVTETSDSSDESESEAETEKEKKKRKLKEKKAKQKSKGKKGKARRKARKEESSESESDSESEEENSLSEDDEDELEQEEELQKLLQMQQLQQLQQQLQAQQSLPPPIPQQQRTLSGLDQLAGLRAPGRALQLDFGAADTIARIQAVRNAKKLKALGLDVSGKQLKREKGEKKEKKSKRGSKLEYKRVDQLWDNKIHNWSLQDTAEEVEDEYDQYLFNVRRILDFEGKYKTTVVDIKSKLLKEALTDIMEGLKGVNLVGDSPAVDPKLLFLYLEDLRDLVKDIKARIKGRERMNRKLKKRNELKIKHIKVLIKYLDKDYAHIKKTLYPMIESGLITFDLLWTLYKPNTLAYTSTYGTADEPRAFKIELAEKECSMLRGEWYNIEGRYLEYDGKNWGFGSMDAEVGSFKGARKITSLACYPLKYHKDEVKMRNQLIERGKKFVALQGVHYKSHEGLAYYKKKRSIIKVNINGRVMVDPAIHRRMLPNYQVSTVKPKEEDEPADSDDEDDSDEECGCDSDDDTDQAPPLIPLDEERAKMKNKDNAKSDDMVNGIDHKKEKGAEIPDKEGEEKKALPVFTDEEYLIASPVVLGFSLVDKLWLEFTVSGIKDIAWNEGAYESLVLEENTKDIVKALVESHKYHPAESIDDVIQGKGKGLVAVLHGPPGCGKTLTCEGISELLHSPLYVVSMGELGTDPRTLELELQKILDIAHAWGAILLLDEADVFLEKRSVQDIHRNALVSIFLRLLEYFQGILFLTTNRVETFDEAFQSRIHIALRYGELSTKAKKAVFKMFIERVRILEGIETMPFKEEDYNSLARHNLNGRQIKNTVRTAQALAVNKKEPLSMEHIKRVLDVALAFDRDLKGGSGFQDAMRSYM